MRILGSRSGTPGPGVRSRLRTTPERRRCRGSNRASPNGLLSNVTAGLSWAEAACLDYRMTTQQVGESPRWQTQWAPLRLEVGWAIRQRFRRQGYAAEIATEALHFASQHLRATTVIAFTERHNLASRAVMERVGMHFAGEILGEGLIEGDDQVQHDAPFAVYAVGSSE